MDILNDCETRCHSKGSFLCDKCPGLAVLPGKFVLECVGVTFVGHKASTPSVIIEQWSSHTLLGTTVYFRKHCYEAMVCVTEEMTHYYAVTERF